MDTILIERTTNHGSLDSHSHLLCMLENNLLDTPKATFGLVDNLVAPMQSVRNRFCFFNCCYQTIAIQALLSEFPFLARMKEKENSTRRLVRL